MANTTPTGFSLTKELPLLILVSLPIILLAIVWNQLPEEVPLHWNFQGEVDRYGSKNSLWLLVLFVNIPIYLLLLFLPKISAKKGSMDLMGNKFYRLRLILQLFMSALAMIIILSTGNLTTWSIETMLAICFAFFLILFGNYMGNIRPNYFVGIRTPWTLENDEVWKQTHHLTGRLWVIGGVLSLGILPFLPANWGLAFTTGFLLISSLGIVVYSYILFNGLSQE